ncbi:HNH endonuclease signature motif containing protein [Streptomyces africanus]|uniref:HNH endonuclease signature motif containing protein n=1 Tax=Streptomyces africanus TaxID=231024 RepID=UPI000A386EDF|nr:HNH endonuclease signature motif containing protein [Streptomyces africanus]
MTTEQRRKISAALTRTTLPQEKRCPRCQETKPASAFRTRKPGGLVLTAYCRLCEAEKLRENPPKPSGKTKPCQIDGCAAPAQAKKLCWTHYNRLRAHGDPLATPVAYRNPLDSLAARTNRDGPLPEGRPSLGRCWIWTGSTNGKYGRVGKQYAHRLAYESAKGPIPDGLQIDHLCRNTVCVNPDHLEAVTGRVNLLRSRGFAARQAAQTDCIHGHPLSGPNLYVDKRGRRHCRECRKRRSREAAARRRTDQ